MDCTEIHDPQIFGDFGDYVLTYLVKYLNIYSVDFPLNCVQIFMISREYSLLT